MALRTQPSTVCSVSASIPIYKSRQRSVVQRVTHHLLDNLERTGTQQRASNVLALHSLIVTMSKKFGRYSSIAIARSLLKHNHVSTKSSKGDACSTNTSSLFCDVPHLRFVDALLPICLSVDHQSALSRQSKGAQNEEEEGQEQEKRRRLT